MMLTDKITDEEFYDQCHNSKGTLDSSLTAKKSPSVNGAVLDLKFVVALQQGEFDSFPSSLAPTALICQHQVMHRLLGAEQHGSLQFYTCGMLSFAAAVLAAQTSCDC